jgi:hypothetical protein
MKVAMKVAKKVAKSVLKKGAKKAAKKVAKKVASVRSFLNKSRLMKSLLQKTQRPGASQKANSRTKKES